MSTSSKALEAFQAVGADVKALTTQISNIPKGDTGAPATILVQAAGSGNPPAGTPANTIVFTKSS